MAFRADRRQHWCVNCDALLVFGLGLCADCIRAIAVGLTAAGLAWVLS